MSYDLIETSENIEPVELYEFTMDNRSFHYTSANSDINNSGKLYLSVPCNRDKTESTQENEKSALNIMMQNNTDFAKIYHGFPPSSAAYVKIFRFNENDPAKERIIVWSGKVVNASFTELEVTFHCERLSTSLVRSGLRRLYQLNCAHALYDNSCRVNRFDFRHEGIVVGIDGLVISLASVGVTTGGYYAGGYIDFNDDGIMYRRFIMSHSGLEVKINLPIDQLKIGSRVAIYAGCDHTTGTCKNKFNNLDNYGGFPFIPQKNPMSGTPIY